MKKSFIKIGIFLLATFLGSIGLVHETSALSGKDIEVQKAIANGVWNCYTNGSIGAPLSLQNTNGYKTYSNGQSILDGSNSNVRNIALPTYFSGIAGGGLVNTPNQISCQNLLFGGNDFNGVFSLNGISTPPTSASGKSAIDKYLSDIGYNVSTSSGGSSGEACIAIYFSDSRASDLILSNKVCFTDLSNGKVTDSTKVSVVSNGMQSGPINIVQSGNRAFKIEDGAWLKTKITVNTGDSIVSSNDTGAIANQMIAAAQAKYSKGCITREEDTDSNGVIETWQYCMAQKDGSSIFYDGNPGESDSATYTIKSASDAFSSARNYLKLPSESGVYTDTNKFILYQSYLAQYYNLSVICNESANAEESAKASGAGYTRTVYAYHEGKFQNCLINVGNLKGSRKVMAVSASGTFDGTTLDAEGVVTALNGLTGVTSLTTDEASRIGKYRNGIDSDGNFVTDPTGAEPGGLENPSEDPGNGSSSDATDACYGSPGALGLSWILCPVLSGLSNTLNYFYGTITGDYIQIKPALVEQNNGTYQAWQIFQNIANIILVIFLLVVIFSQLTGIGIDNYGIKKILPRLIICAILINLSYFIMQFLIDMSNIIGNSIGGLFNMAGANIEHANIVGAGTDGNIPENIIGLSAIIGAAGGIAALVANPAILLSFLLVLLSGVFAVIMMWLILIARQAGVVIAVVIAPVAFAMYLFPNTSKTTKSWVNLIKSLLLLYPLAALLIGASYFASDLLAGLDESGNMILPAMILRVAPFFALPALFRKSVDAMGNLGTRIQGVGRGLSRAATGATRNADWYKNAQERGIERRTRLRAGIDQDGNEATGWRGLLRSRSDRNRARYRSQYLKNQSEQDKADMLNDPGYMEAMRRKQEFEAAEAARDATKYTQSGYIEGKEAQGRLSRENEIEGARLYTTPGFEGSKRSQYDESRQSELRKMFTEQNLSQGTTADQRRDRLSDLLRNGLNGENDAAEAEALIDLLNDKGDIRQLIDGLNGVTTAQLGAMDAGLRSRIAGRAQATGNALLKGWAKSVNRGNNISIDDYIMRSGNGGLNNYITTDAGTSLFDNADKDTLEFLAAHNGARALGTNGAEAALASMATSAANASPRAANAVNDMLLASEANNAGAINTIGSHITAENLAKMKRNNIATTFMAHAGSLNNAISTITQPGNEQLLSSMSNDVRTTLGI